MTWQTAANPHIFVSGCSGMGKSHFLRQLTRQLPEQGVRCIIFDCFHDWEQLPQIKLAGVEVLDVREIGMAPLAPLRLTEDYAETTDDIAFRLAETIRVIYRLRSSQENRLNEALYGYLSSGKKPATLSGLVDFICRDKELRARMESVLLYLRNLSRTIRETIGGFELNINHPGITALDFSRVTATSQQSLFVELILGELWSRKLSFKNSAPVVVVLDEAQKFSFHEGACICRILREGRKFDFAAWLASQWISDKNATAALQQAALRVLFRPETSHVHSLTRQLAGSDRALAAKYERALLDLERGEFLYHDPEGRAIRAFAKAR